MGKLRRIIVICICLAGIASCSQETSTVVHTVYVTQPAKIATKIVYKTRTVTIYRSGYPLPGDDPAWVCAMKMYSMLINVSDGGIAPDAGIWTELCPGVSQPAN